MRSRIKSRDGFLDSQTDNIVLSLTQIPDDKLIRIYLNQL